MLLHSLYFRVFRVFRGQSFAMHVYRLPDAQITLPSSDNIQKLYLELSSECNFDCQMCFRHSFSAPVGSMSADVLQAVRREIATLPHLKEVVLGGLGEPLMHPQISEMIAFLKQRQIWVTLTTNGALLEPLLDDLLAAGADKIAISFETGDIGHSNEHCVFELAKIIQQKKEQRGVEKPLLALFMVATTDNIGNLRRVAERLRHSGIREVILSNLLPANDAQKELVLYPRPEAKEIAAFRNELFQNILLDKVHCQTPAFEIKTERSCDFIENQATVIRWDGAVAPCYRLLHARKEIVLNVTKEVCAYSFGNLLEHRLLDIWNRREYAWFRFSVHNSRYPSCIDCSLRDGCEFILSTAADCWGNEHTCADCLWMRRLVKCP